MCLFSSQVWPFDILALCPRLRVYFLTFQINNSIPKTNVPILEWVIKQFFILTIDYFNANIFLEDRLIKQRRLILGQREYKFSTSATLLFSNDTYIYHFI